jgi:hypothetical protein
LKSEGQEIVAPRPSRQPALQKAARQFPVPGKPSVSPALRGFSPCFLLFLYSWMFGVQFYSGLITPVNTDVITLLSGGKIVLVHLNASKYPRAVGF